MSEHNNAEQIGEPGVRFASHTQLISPETSISPTQTLRNDNQRGEQELNPEAQEEIKQFKSTLQQAVQSKRAQQFQFEPVSLPPSQSVSRVGYRIW